MTRSVIALMAVWLAGTAVPAQAATPNFREGNWDVTMRMQVTGAPFQMPPMTMRREMCLTSKNYLPDTRQPGQECRQSEPVIQGDTVSWTMSCKTREGTIDGKGSVTYRGDSYEGRMEAVMTSSGSSSQTMRYQYQMEGRYLGPCR